MRTPRHSKQLAELYPDDGILSEESKDDLIRMQKNREVPPDGPVAEFLEFCGRCADDAPVPVTDRQSEQFVTDGATNEIRMHAGMVTANRRR